jgi:selenocysteine lyase/cysteine desulfurase
MSNNTVEVQMEALTTLQNEGNVLYDKAVESANSIRETFLTIFNTNGKYQAGLITDVSTAMNHLAESFSGQKVVLLEKDFPAVTSAWVIRNFDIVWVQREAFEYDLSKIEDALRNGADVLALSWVMYNSGARLDMKAISDMCAKYKVALIVDGTQGLGANPLDLSNLKIDVLLASCFKWFLSGYGIGVAIANNDFLTSHPLQIAGHNTILSSALRINDLNNYKVGILRMELGHIKAQQIFALASSLSELTAIGLVNIQRRTQQLMDYLVHSLERSTCKFEKMKSQSTNILLIDGSTALMNKLTQANIDVTYRNEKIRIGLYFYNNEEDIDKLVEVIAAVNC